MTASGPEKYSEEAIKRRIRQRHGRVRKSAKEDRILTMFFTIGVFFLLLTLAGILILMT